MTGVPSTPHPHPLAWLEPHAEHRRADGLRRELHPRAAGDDLLDLAGNDYLGLARHPRVVAEAVAAVRTWGAGSTGSRLVTGTTALHAELEAALADFCGTPAALVFSSGYAANLGAVTALSGPGALIVSDAANHASLVDACRLSRARVAVVPHGDVAAVDAALAARGEARALVVTESVDSTDGELAPLVALHAVCRARGALLVVDEAHGLGVCGPGGRGLLAAVGLAGADDVVTTVTLSKALGSQGGAVLGPRAVIAHLVDTARSFIFDTGLAPACAGAALAALRVLRDEPSRPTAVLAGRGRAGRGRRRAGASVGRGAGRAGRAGRGPGRRPPVRAARGARGLLPAAVGAGGDEPAAADGPRDARRRRPRAGPDVLAAVLATALTSAPVR